MDDNTNASDDYDYFTDPENRFSIEYESGYYDNTTAAGDTTLSPTNAADVVAQSFFNSPLAFWVSFLLAIVAAVSMTIIIYKSNQLAKRERHARAAEKNGEFEINFKDIERDDGRIENGNVPDDRFSLDPPQEDEPLSQSQLDSFGI